MGWDMQQLGVQLSVIALVFLGGGRGRGLPGSLSCLNNYVNTVSCTWMAEEPMGEGPFHLHFTNIWSKGQNATCKLTASLGMQNLYHCTIRLASQILETDGYRVSLQGIFLGSNRTFVPFPEYSPRQHIKLDPPSNLQANITATKCQIWWSVPWFLAEILQYELQYKEHSTSWEIALNKTPTSSLPQIEIEATEFRNGITYIARVRCKVSENEDSYHSQWSEWSQTTLFQRAGIPQLPEKLFNIRTLQFLFIPLSFVTVLYVFWNCKLSSRAKNLSCLNIPTPAAFFQPLYNLHNGNFKTVPAELLFRVLSCSVPYTLSIFVLYGQEYFYTEPNWVGPDEACGQLREEASNLNRVPADRVSALSTQEMISQISVKSMESKDLVAVEEDYAFTSSPSQQYVPSRYVRAEEIEVRLTLLFAQDYADNTVGLEISEIIKSNLDSPHMERNDSSCLQHLEGDFPMLQESLEMANASFSSSDYCSLFDNGITGALIPAELLKLSEDNSLVKHLTEENNIP